MNPALYLPLARAYRDRQAPVRAADFYRRFIAALPAHPEVAQAIQELQAVDPEGPV